MNKDILKDFLENIKSGISKSDVISLEELLGTPIITKEKNINNFTNTKSTVELGTVQNIINNELNKDNVSDIDTYKELDNKIKYVKDFLYPLSQDKKLICLTDQVKHFFTSERYNIYYETVEGFDNNETQNVLSSYNTLPLHVVIKKHFEYIESLIKLLNQNQEECIKAVTSYKECSEKVDENSIYPILYLLSNKEISAQELEDFILMFNDIPIHETTILDLIDLNKKCDIIKHNSNIIVNHYEQITKHWLSLDYNSELFKDLDKIISFLYDSIKSLEKEDSSFDFIIDVLEMKKIKK